MIAVQQDQCARTVLMVRPSGFGYHEEAAASNAFQKRPAALAANVRQKALDEFNQVVFQLNDFGIDVLVLDPFDQDAPDAVFPNNWFSTHADGSIVRYPMMAEKRRAERSDALSAALRKNGFAVGRVIDLSPLERVGVYLEGTGSLVLDRQAMIAYAAVSPRTHERAFEAFEKRTGFKVMPFKVTDRSGGGNYHTDVIMNLGSRTSILCSSVFAERSEFEFVMNSLEATMKRVVLINESQMNAFCGNVKELRDREGRSVFVMSTTAQKAFTPRQLDILQAQGTILALDIPTIEQVGGGSVRSMLAEIFLPKAKSRV